MREICSQIRRTLALQLNVKVFFTDTNYDIITVAIGSEVQKDVICC